MKSGKPTKRGDIPRGFVSAANHRPDGVAADGHAIESICFLSRFLTESVLDHPVQNMFGVPSWSAFNIRSLILNENMTPTAVGFTPIIPYPATRHVPSVINQGRHSATIWNEMSKDFVF